MSAREHRFPVSLLGPAAAGGIAAAWVPGVPRWALLALLVGIAVRGLLAALRREIPRGRAWSLLWILGPAAATVYVAGAERLGVAAGPALLAAGCVAAGVAAVAPSTPAGWVRLLALSALLVVGGAVAWPSPVTLAASMAFCVALVPAVLGAEARLDPVGVGSGDLGVRRVRAPAPARTSPAGAAATAAVLALGLPLGLAFFLALPARPEVLPPAAGGSDRRESAARGASAEDLDGLRSLVQEDAAHVAQTGARTGRRSAFVSTLRANPRIALTVRFGGGSRGPAGPLWMRGWAYDRFDGRAWDRSPAVAAAVPAGQEGWVPAVGAPTAGRRWHYLVTDRLGGADAALPLLPEPDRVRLVDWGGAAVVLPCRDGVVAVAGRWGPDTEYEAESLLTAPDAGDLEGRRSDAAVSPLPGYVAPPPEAEALRRLALRVVGDETNAARRARRLESWLRGPDFEYAMADLPLDRRRPVADFLLRARRGHCWCFASSMTLLMRSLGHPARFVVGYRGGDWMESIGEWSFRGTHAHAWCEVWFEGAGWRLYDPTPPARESHTQAVEAEPGASGPAGWIARLARFTPDDRRALLGLLGGAAASVARSASDHAVAWGVGAALLAAVAIAFLRLRRRRRAEAVGPREGAGAAAGPYARALAALARRGVARRRPETPDEYGRRVERALPDAAVPLHLLTLLHVEARYGGRVPGPEDLRRSSEAADAVAASVNGGSPSAPA